MVGKLWNTISRPLDVIITTMTTELVLLFLTYHHRMAS